MEPNKQSVEPIKSVSSRNNKILIFGVFATLGLLLCCCFCALVYGVIEYNRTSGGYSVYPTSTPTPIRTVTPTLTITPTPNVTTITFGTEYLTLSKDWISDGPYVSSIATVPYETCETKVQDDTKGVRCIFLSAKNRLNPRFTIFLTDTSKMYLSGGGAYPAVTEDFSKYSNAPSASLFDITFIGDYTDPDAMEGLVKAEDENGDYEIDYITGCLTTKLCIHFSSNLQTFDSDYGWEKEIELFEKFLEDLTILEVDTVN